MKLSGFAGLSSVLVVLSVLVAGQSASAGAHEKLLALLPKPLPAAAVAQAGPAFYEPENLYQYMDGAADLFVLYGVQALLHQEVRAKEVDVTIDIFDMGTPESAFGMYAAERSPNYRFVKLGTEGYQDEGALNFLQDRYYVKLAGFGTAADGVLDTMARSLSGNIGGNAGFPALLTRLPSENRKPHSEQYMPKDPLGHPFLGPAYVVAYAAGDEENKVVVTVAHDPADARQRLKQLAEHFTRTGQCKPAPELGDGAVRAHNSFEGDVLALPKGAYVVLVVNPARTGEQLLRSVSKSLE